MDGDVVLNGSKDGVVVSQQLKGPSAHFILLAALLNAWRKPEALRIEVQLNYNLSFFFTIQINCFWLPILYSFMGAGCTALLSRPSGFSKHYALSLGRANYWKMSLKSPYGAVGGGA